ncbi:MAG: hypothetical protein DDG60_00185 [Anaerolineae bacterium]|nr:MAG: hypothetical protein DDG60_00185 [Anaerolineae bacterium]
MAKRIMLGFVAVVVFALAFALRERAATFLPRDSDEGVYLDAGGAFALLIRQSHWSGFLQTNPNPEHPPLNKILFGLAISRTNASLPFPDPHEAVHTPPGAAARRVSVWLGALTAGLLTLVNPLGGLFYAIHTMSIKYTAEIMLEGLPSLTSLGAVLAYLQFQRTGKHRWWLASALLLGLTASGKYLYALVGLAILLDWYFRRWYRPSPPHQPEKPPTAGLLRHLAPPREILLWGLSALLFFLLTNPYLWPNPPGRLADSLFFHSRYSTGAPEVIEAAFPVYQPFIWLVTSAADWHPQDVFLFSLDLFIIGLAAFGLVRLWKKAPVFILWLAVGMLFLLAWPTKWPQYILVLTAPLSLAAGEALLILLQAIWHDLATLKKGTT